VWRVTDFRRRVTPCCTHSTERGSAGSDAINISDRQS
jgi:hypothetical protein